MTPPNVLFIPTPQVVGGSDWDTYADGILYDWSFDTSRAPYPSSFPDAGKNQQLITAYTTSGWSNRWGQSRGVNHSSQYTSTTGFHYSYDTGYSGGAGVLSEFPPYIAEWDERDEKSQYGSGKYVRGWRILQLENPLYTRDPNSVTYIAIDTPEGTGEGLPTRTRSTIKVALTNYDGNVANWRDFDGWTLQQQIDFEIGITATSPWTITSITNNYVNKHYFAVGNTFPQGCWQNGKARLVFGSEAGNYGATSGAFGQSTQYSFASTTDAQSYISRVAMFQEIVGGTYYSPLFNASTGSQNSYNNTPSTLGGSHVPSAGDIVRISIYDW